MCVGFPPPLEAFAAGSVNAVSAGGVVRGEDAITCHPGPRWTLAAPSPSSRTVSRSTSPTRSRCTRGGPSRRCTCAYGAPPVGTNDVNAGCPVHASPTGQPSTADQNARASPTSSPGTSTKACIHGMGDIPCLRLPSAAVPKHAAVERPCSEPGRRSASSPADSPADGNADATSFAKRPRAGPALATVGASRTRGRSVVFVGSAGHGRVRVELSEAAATPAVQLLPGWRTATAERLGPAVLQAFAAATAARLQALAAAPPEFDFTAAAALRALDSGHHAAVLLADAARELPAFLGQLAALHAGARTAASPGGQVAATVRGGQVVALTVEAAWQARADDATLAHGLGEAL